ncbi:MAG: TonB-dependent receptor [Bacteroidota bacterium]
MYSRIFTQFFFLLLIFPLVAQYQITGKIQSSNTDFLSGVAVQLLERNKGTVSNSNGNYAIVDLKPGSYYLAFSYVGFETRNQLVEIIDQNAELDIQLFQVPSQLSEVVVTANRRLENIQSTPSSIAAVNAKQIEQLQVKQINELNSIAPNFHSYDDGGDGSFTLFSSRGISTIDSSPVVGLYLDDVPYFNTFAFPISVNDVDQIEVLRGPQGTLYGRNALAGVIKVTTKKPGPRTTGFATVGWGNLGSQQYGVGLTLPLAKEKLFLRLSGNFDKRDGFVENEATERDVQNLLSSEGNLRLKYYASDQLSFGLNYNIQFRESDAFAQVLAFPDFGVTFQSILEDNPYSISYNEDIVKEATTHNLALNTTYDLSSLQLTSVTAFQFTDRFRRDDFDFSPLPQWLVETDIALLNFTQEFRLSSNTTGPLNWTAGIFLFRTEETANQTDTQAELDEQFQVTSTTTTLEDVEDVNRGLAVFGQASYAFTDQLSLTAGIRFDYEEVDAEVVRNTAGMTDSFSEKADFTAVSPKVALGYQLNSNVFLFANVARGYRPGGVNTFVTNAEDAPFDPESTWNYELGLKTTLLQDRLKLNLTSFWINYTNQQIFTVIDTQTLESGTENIGESRSFGIELETQAVLTKGLSVNLNVGYLNTEILDYTVNGIDFATFQPIEIDESGNELPVSPAFSGNVNVNYILPLSEKLNVEASADYLRQSEIFWGVDNSTIQEDYGLLNARLGVTSKNLDIFFWGKNLLDEAYYSYGFGAGGFNAAVFGLPQTYGVTLTGKF